MFAGDQTDQANDRVANERRRNSATNGQEELGMGWTEENAAAIAERRSWIEAHGAPLADLQVLKLP